MYQVGKQVIKEVFANLEDRYKLLMTKAEIKFVLTKLFEYYGELDRGKKFTATDVDYVYSHAQRSGKSLNQGAIHAVVTAYEQCAHDF